MPVVDVTTGRTLRVGDLPPSGEGVP